MKRIFKNKKGQNVAEYAILIALVVGAIIAMQTFLQRTSQARLKDASQYMVDNTNFGADAGTTYKTGQYEPYYKETDYNTQRDSTDFQSVNAGTKRTTTDTESTRTGSSTTGYTVNGIVDKGMTITE